MKPTEEMITRFLQWRLPENFRPDCGISFDANAAIKLNPNNSKYEPVGTNLFDYEQAKQMLEFVLETTHPVWKILKLHLFGVDDVIDRLYKDSRYLHEPLTDNERKLIRDVLDMLVRHNQPEIEGQSS